MAKKEAKQVTPAPTETVAQPKVAFDVWWAMTSKKLPVHIHKEVVKADFKARGLSMEESLSAFGKALDLFGVKLK